MKRVLTLLIAGMTCAGAMTVAAAMDIASYERDRAQPASSPGRGLLKIYLIGVGEGFKWSNATLGSQHVPLLFCTPEAPPLTHESLLYFIDEALLRQRDAFVKLEMPIEAILLKTLQERLPCHAK